MYVFLYFIQTMYIYSLAVIKYEHENDIIAWERSRYEIISANSIR